MYHLPAAYEVHKRRDTPGVSADFDQALAVVLEHEGAGFTSDPRDPGGPTKFGITLRALRDLRPDATAEDVAALTREEASCVYRVGWWDALGLARFRDQQVATKVLDVTVNLGRTAGIRLLQSSVNCCLDPAAENEPRLAVDGVLGPKTLAAANSTTPRELLLELGFHMLDRYHKLLELHPEMEVFRQGWARRAAWPYWGRSAVWA